MAIKSDRDGNVHGPVCKAASADQKAINLCCILDTWYFIILLHLSKSVTVADRTVDYLHHVFAIFLYGADETRPLACG